ncbi:Short-chain dehydrogenase/reductase SDR [Penicillium riverlandense]|uniref:Short-chain dehydrogenase/reductase SDR n=1 Tax=Penicillium riverlandense TaxID=1903569 RepID=UPI0025465C39|nr:Short-chain dehydrogenase/reductase SDR [Penicillium riverlandense]KAJ5814508.1 Short-chain dehydrogenase/reductase SDR [Penicillium riverlandense]
MAQFIPNLSSESLLDKVVLITGGSNGIGASLVRQCLENGANVCFGDLDNITGERLVKKCLEVFHPAEEHQAPRVVFQSTDVTNYDSVLGLFDLAFETYSRIDHVVSAAGIVEIGNWFDFGLTLQTVRQKPTHKVLDVNLLGSMYVSRIASVYLRHNRGPDADRSILLFSSVAGFKDSPSLFVYQASKHGVTGLMRSLRSYISSPYKHSLRVNTICPWVTETDTIKKIEQKWKQANLPTNSPQEVATVATGGRAWEIEKNINRLETQWLGEAPSKALAMGQELLDDGAIWTATLRKKSIISSGVPPGVPTSKLESIQIGVGKEQVNGQTNGLVNGVH